MNEINGYCVIIAYTGTDSVCQGLQERTMNNYVSKWKF